MSSRGKQLVAAYKRGKEDQFVAAVPPEQQDEVDRVAKLAGKGGFSVRKSAA